MRRARGGRGGGGAGAAAARRRAAAARSINWRRSASYTVTLEVGGKTLTQKAQIAKTQGWSLGPSPQIIR